MDFSVGYKGKSTIFSLLMAIIYTYNWMEQPGFCKSSLKIAFTFIGCNVVGCQTLPIPPWSGRHAWQFSVPASSLHTLCSAMRSIPLKLGSFPANPASCRPTVRPSDEQNDSSSAPYSALPLYRWQRVESQHVQSWNLAFQLPNSAGPPFEHLILPVVPMYVRY